MWIRFTAHVVAVAIAAISLGGCVESNTPLIMDAKPVLGERFEVHLYENFAENKANNFHAASYEWKDGQYARVSAFTNDARRFVAKPLEGNDFIIQSTDERGQSYLYWIGRRLTPGVYQIFPLEEGDASESVRSAACVPGGPGAICHVKSYDHLVALAKATASKPVRDAALGVVLAK